MGTFRAASILTGFFALTVPLMPVQAALLRLSPKGARRFPHWYHRQVCRLIGVRLTIEGRLAEDRPVLLVSNHTSWLDIPVLSAVAPVSFVAKKEVARWPFVSWLAKLQRSVFVDRERRSAVGATTNEIMARLATGDTVVLFAEGTSSDGIRVLPFKSALVGSVHQALGTSHGHDSIAVQPLSLAYTRFDGLPVGRALRERVAWYGDADLIPHFIRVLASGATDVTLSWGDAIALNAETDRKQVTRDAEAAVRRMTAAALRAPTWAIENPSEGELTPKTV